MGRSKRPTRFGWVRDEQPEEPEATADGLEEVDEPEEPSVRVVHRLAMDELSDLVEKLVRLPPSRRAQLPIDDEAKGQLELLATLGKTPARRRQALRTRLFLRDADHAVLRELAAGHDPKEELLQRAERWRGRLLAGGDDDLDAFLAAFPGGERQRLRTDAREARGEGPAAKRAFRRLFQAVRDAMETATEAAPEGEEPG